MALEDNPELADLHYISAKLYLKQGKKQEAINSYKSALISPRNLKAPVEKIKQELNKLLN